MSPVTHPLVHLHLDARLGVELEVESGGTGGVLLWWGGTHGVSGEGTAVSPPLGWEHGGHGRGDKIGVGDTMGVTQLDLGTPGHKRGDRIGPGDTKTQEG